MSFPSLIYVYIYIYFFFNSSFFRLFCIYFTLRCQASPSMLSAVLHFIARHLIVQQFNGDSSSGDK